MITEEKYGPWAVIAGGSEGMGLAFAKKIGLAGINVVLVARRAEQLEVAAREVRDKTGVQVRMLPLDLSGSDVLDRMRKATDDIEVGLFIFNAAAASMKPFFKQSQDELLVALRISGFSQTILVQHFGSKMAHRGRGGIIMVGSLAGNAGVSNIATYCGAKAYTQMLGEGLYAELKPQGIDVLVLVVAAVDTPNRRRSGAADVPGMTVLTPDDVTQQALDELGIGGPVAVPPALQPQFQQMCSLPRRQVAEMMGGAVPLPKKSGTK